MPTSFLGTSKSRFIPVVIKDIFVYVFVHYFLCNFTFFDVSLTKICSHPSVVTIEASARLNFAKISPSSVRIVSAKSKKTKQLKIRRQKTLPYSEMRRIFENSKKKSTIVTRPSLKHPMNKNKI